MKLILNVRDPKTIKAEFDCRVFLINLIEEIFTLLQLLLKSLISTLNVLLVQTELRRKHANMMLGAVR